MSLAFQGPKSTLESPCKSGEILLIQGSQPSKGL